MGDAPVLVKSLKDMKFKFVSVGGNTVIALSSDNKIMTWSKASRWISVKNSPVIIQPRRIVFSKVAAGDEHVLALTGGGVVLSWGIGTNGKLGHGDANDVEKPKMIESLSGIKFKQIACGKDSKISHPSLPYF